MEPDRLLPWRPQVPQVREVAEFGRDGARQVAAGEEQSDNAPIAVGVHAVPLIERAATQPVGLVRPLLAAGGVVERLEHGSVGVGGGAGQSGAER